MTSNISKRSYRIKKENFLTENPILSTVLISAGVGLVLALILKRDKVAEISSSILDKSKSAARDIVNKGEALTGFSKSNDDYADGNRSVSNENVINS